MLTYNLNFSHPLTELCIMQGFYEEELFPLVYKYAGTHVIHNRSEYSDPNIYDEILNKVDDFIFNTNQLLSAMKQHNLSKELIYKVVENWFFGDTPTELREKFVIVPSK